MSRALSCSNLLALCLIGDALCGSAASAADQASLQVCSTQSGTSIGDAGIDSASIVEKPGSGAQAGDFRPYCKIHATASPTPRSHIGIEVWLPLTGWSSRIQMTGNGGYISQIRFDQLTSVVQAGDVAVATDTGHQGDSLAFGFDNPDAIADWGHRAVHESIVFAKALATKFFGAPAKHSYFEGCSTGGHQALMEAQRYPDDFDGILAGDPGNNRTNLNFGFLWQFTANHPDGDSNKPLLTVDDLKLVNAAALKACDDLDGVKDGIIGRPALCHFDPASLRCTAGSNASCLDDAKIDALHRMYAGAKRSDTGEQIYPGWTIGSEYIEGAGGWYIYWANPQKPDEPQRVDYFRRWAFHDLDWNWYRFGWDAGVDKAHAALGPLVDATDPDLSAFRARGGKLIIYQGSVDPVVSATDTIAYYERMTRKTRYAENFTRFYMVPGMAHCMGGPGATVFSSGPDAGHNIKLALRDWVEMGVAPDRLTAARDISKSPDSHVAMTRPLCVWPKLPAYTGHGDTNDARNFICR